MKNLYLRKAKINDSKFLLKLYNLGVEENLFKNKKKISLIEHNKWFKSSLKSKLIKIFICKKKNLKIGYIKLNIFRQNSSYISIIIKPTFRKNNIGSFFLNKVCKDYFKSSRNQYIFAEVLKKNKNSKNFFKKNKFKSIKVSNNLSEIFNKKNYLFVRKK